MEAKKGLRKAMKDRLGDLPDRIRRSASVSIKGNLTALSEWKKARTIGITMSTAEEIGTEAIIQQAWTEKKQVAVPKADLQTRNMDFRIIDSFDEVEKAFAGIREPIIERTQSVPFEEIDLLVVPGLVFDERGYRVGFGGGFYDRLLKTYSGFTVSLAFEIQLMESVPVESFDRSVNIIVTERRIIRTGTLS